MKINHKTELTIPVRNLVGLIIAVAVFVWAYFAVEERLNMLEHLTKVLEMEMKMNSEFRVKWPRGELGSLPDDAEQNMRLQFIEKDMEVMAAHVDNLRIKSIKQEELHNPPHPFLPVVEHPKKTEAGGIR